MLRHHWLKEEEATMAFLFTQGKTDDEIGLILNRDSNSIRAKRQKLGLRIFPKKPQVEPVPTAVTQSMVTPKHSDNLPDVGEQLSHVIFEQKINQSLLQDILTTLKETLELFKRLDAENKRARQ